MARAIKIDPVRQTVTEIDISSYDDMVAAVGGMLAIARSWDHGDTLYVDDEGLLKPTLATFKIQGVDQQLAGVGVIIGRDTYDEAGDFVCHRDTELRVDTVERQVTWPPAPSWADALDGTVTNPPLLH